MDVLSFLESITEPGPGTFTEAKRASRFFFTNYGDDLLQLEMEKDTCIVYLTACLTEVSLNFILSCLHLDSYFSPLF